MFYERKLDVEVHLGITENPYYRNLTHICNAHDSPGIWNVILFGPGRGGSIESSRERECE